MANRVDVRDNGYAKMIAALDALPKLAITVGVHAEEGAADEGNGRTVAEVAEANEFGLGVPARPAITGWADENREAFTARMATEAAAALKAKVSPAQRLDALAQVAAGEIQARIAGGVPPPNSPATIARKGSSTPLIDKGQFRSSIRGKCVDGSGAPVAGGAGSGGKGGGASSGKKAKRSSLARDLKRAGRKLARFGKGASKAARKAARAAVKAARKAARATKKTARRAVRAARRATRKRRR